MSVDTYIDWSTAIGGKPPPTLVLCTPLTPFRRSNLPTRGSDLQAIEDLKMWEGACPLHIGFVYTPYPLQAQPPPDAWK
ncbi:hypothetical protein DENIT_11310 [Pseudomonas veronii]|nr:hypothetical protein DENIT_11310 [Pseudomonas veronii]